MKTAKSKMDFLLSRKSLKKAESTVTRQASTPVGEINDLLSGGWPYGKVSMIYGDPSTGKTSVVVESVAREMQKDKNHVTVLVPAERSEDLSYYEKLGLDLDRTVILDKPVYFIEEVFQELEEIMENGGCDSVIIDSWDGMLSKKQMYTKDGTKKDMDEETVATKAAAGSRLWPRIKGLISTHDILFIIIAQIRTGGIGGQTTFKTMSGGHALVHNSQVIMCSEMKGMVTEAHEGATKPVGHEVKFTLKKSKINTKTHQNHTVIYNYENSWDELQGLWVQALASGALIKGGGGWYSCPLLPETGKDKERKMRGEKATRDFFRISDNMQDLQTLVNEVLTKGKVSDAFEEVDKEDELEELEDAFETT